MPTNVQQRAFKPDGYFDYCIIVGYYQVPELWGKEALICTMDQNIYSYSLGKKFLINAPIMFYLTSLPPVTMTTLLMGSVGMLEAMLPPGYRSQISELQGEENALKLFESKKPLKTVGGQWALRELRQLGTREKNMRERGWRCNLLQGEDMFFVEAQKALLERQGKNWSSKSMLQAHKQICMITGVKSFTAIWMTKAGGWDDSHSKSFLHLLTKELSFKFNIV